MLISLSIYREAAAWQTPWSQDTLKLYSDLPKHQATALFLLRTEVIGLRSWLASVCVPGITPECDACNWHEQTVRHVLMMCPKYTDARSLLISRTSSEELEQILSRPDTAQTAARWLVQQGILKQFETARQIEEEDTTDHIPFQPLDDVE